ncbi:MAG: ATP-dependent DNA helicase RecG, partial [Anaerolineales bacterium]
TEAVVSDGTGYLRLTWFNQPWMANRLKPGQQVVFSGKVDMYLGRLTMNNPDCEALEQEHLHTNRIVPVYPLSGQITQRWLRRIMHQVVKYWAPKTPDFLPAELRQSAELMDLPTALYQIHFPDNQESLKAARYRLAFDEIFLLQLGVLSQKRLWQTATAPVIPMPENWLRQQIERLPFALTNAQQKALQDIRHDLQSGKPMNRLLQGDVGSGKTVVAAIAVAAVAQQGFQAALMAPTSILAEQHYLTLLHLLTNQHNAEVPLQQDQVALLVGDISESEKQKIRTGLKSGEIKLVVGTHALLEDPVEFKHLQLIIVDEQHRFGVEQRAILRSKGKNPHLLVMTATPIPRSLALTVYGDLDLSVMDEMPVGRQPVETHVLHPVERERAYQLIRKQVQEGYQAFIIYPLIEQGEREEVKAAVEEHERLQKEVFPELRLALLHGRMRGDEKDQIMHRFRNKEFDILVSTSVVEVGVDIPNATVMLVEGANRFGLAQLHQFRGRVGRGSAKAYCLLIPETENALENERLAVMTETNDGFVLAERDLEQRGPGQFLGTQQSGFSDLRMASLTDLHLIEKARKQAQLVFEKDPLLNDPSHQELKKMVMRLFESGKGDIS